jgi:hypothetical protein
MALGRDGWMDRVSGPWGMMVMVEASTVTTDGGGFSMGRHGRPLLEQGHWEAPHAWMQLTPDYLWEGRVEQVSPPPAFSWEVE